MCVRNLENYITSKAVRRHALARSAQDELGGRQKFVFGDLKVPWRGAAPNAPAAVVVAAVARAVPAVVVAGICHWHATKVSADANKNEPAVRGGVHGQEVGRGEEGRNWGLPP
jgi:hypothetical protein